MSEFVSASNVILDCSATTVDEVLRYLSDQAVALGMADDADGVYKAFKAREAEGTTGMMGGFAIPHAKSEAITKAGVIVVKFSEGVAWDSMDHQPVTCAISLLTPLSEAGTTHLQLLSKVAVMLMDEGVRNAVQAADEPEKIASLINEALEAE